MKITFILDGEKIVVEAEAGRSLLDIALIAGIPAPYSCMAGECGTCVALVGGEFLKTCQTLPSSDVVVDYDKSPTR